MAVLDLDAKDVDGLAGIIDQYGEKARTAINEVLHGSGADVIKNNITNLLPVSGASWKKKAPAAKSAMPGAFTKVDKNLGVEILAKGRYGYLYYPDDGSNTRSHAGNQHFMIHGAEASTEEIIDQVLRKIMEA